MNTDLLTVSIVFTFLESNIFGIRQCEVFSDWLLLLSNMDLGFLHVFSLLDSSGSLLFKSMYLFPGLPWWLSNKDSAYQCRRHVFDPWIGKIPWRRKWKLTPVFLSGKSHRQRRLAGYNPWGHKESNTTERLTLLSSQLTKHQKQLHPSATTYAMYLEQFTTEKSVTHVWLTV